MGGLMAKITGKDQASDSIRNPLLSRSKSKTLNNNRKLQVSPARVSREVGSSTNGQAVGPVGPNKNMSSPPIQPIQQTTSQVRSNDQQIIRHKMNLYCFKKSRNIIQIHQRHATTCANVLNKGFDASTSDINNLAPNTSLTAIGIQQCMQLSDFLLFCKSKNVNYITSQDYTTIDDLNLKLDKTQYYYISEEDLKKKLGNIEDPQNLISKSYTGNKTRIGKLKLETLLSLLNIRNQKYTNILKNIPTIKNQQQPQQPPQPLHELNQKKELRPMLIFCCSELLRTQQTLFITYFDIIKDYLKNRRKIIVLFWLNEQHFSKMSNADNFVLTLDHTKKQWKYFIKRIKNLEFDKTFMENIGREVGHAELVEFSKKLNLEEQLQTSTAFSQTPINYEDWEDIFYVSPHIYPIRDPKAILLPNFSFDNRRFSSSHRIKFGKGFGKEMYDPKEMYRELPTILSIYISISAIITHDSDYGVDFYEERISPDVKMNLVFVSHHNSGENTMKYLTSDDSEAVFRKQQLMNCELVILPKGGILGKKEYMTEFGGVNDEEYKAAVENQLKEEEKKQTDSVLKGTITSYFNDKRLYINKYTDAIRLLENARRNLLNELYTQQNSVSDYTDKKKIISSIEKIIIYFKYLQSKSKITTPQPTSEFKFTLKNRIFPVGFYDTIFKVAVVGRKNKSGQIKQIYPLFILYNSLLGIFFTPLDIIKQEVAILPEVTFDSSVNSGRGVLRASSAIIEQTAGGFLDIFKKKVPQPQPQPDGERTGIGASDKTFNLSFPLKYFLNMTLQEYKTFLEKSEEILKGIINYYYNQPRSSNQAQSQAGVASAAVPVMVRKENQYFYDYKKLLELVKESIPKITEYNNKIKNPKEKLNNEINKNTQINQINKNTNSQSKILAKSLIQSVYVTPTLFQYLRENFDTKTLVQNFSSCLFDFCAITDPARNRLRQIVREKLKLEVVEKNYKKPFKLEVQRHLQKLIDDYEKVSGKVTNNNIEVITISKGLFSSKKASKKKILDDIRNIDPFQKIDKSISSLIPAYKKVFEIYKKYNIIDNSAYSKIYSLLSDLKIKYNATVISNNKTSQIKETEEKNISDEYALKIVEIFRPFQKKFLDSIINRDIRHRNDQKNESIKDKTKKIVNIMNTPQKKSRYIVIENEEDKPPLNYIKYQNIPIV